VSCTTGGNLFQKAIWITGIKPDQVMNDKACTAVSANARFPGFQLVKCDMEMGIVCQVKPKTGKYAIYWKCDKALIA
jgi:hypothetical protein